MRYALARAKQDSVDKAYRVYVTDALKAIAENTARYVGGGYIKARYADLIEPKPEETRTPEQIVDRMKEKIAKVGGEDNKPV
jgi:hypothetical protein